MEVAVGECRLEPGGGGLSGEGQGLEGGSLKVFMYVRETD